MWYMRKKMICYLTGEQKNRVEQCCIVFKTATWDHEGVEMVYKKKVCGRYKRFCYNMYYGLYNNQRVWVLDYCGRLLLVKK